MSHRDRTFALHRIACADVVSQELVGKHVGDGCVLHAVQYCLLLMLRAGMWPQRVVYGVRVNATDGAGTGGVSAASNGRFHCQLHTAIPESAADSVGVRRTPATGAHSAFASRLDRPLFLNLLLLEGLGTLRRVTVTMSASDSHASQLDSDILESAPYRAQALYACMSI